MPQALQNFSESFSKKTRILKEQLIEHAWSFESSMIPFARFALISLPFYFILNLHLLPAEHTVLNYLGEHLDDLIIRSLCALLCLAVSLKSHWPKNVRHYLPLIWYCAVLFFMPFFATYMTFKNHFAAAWALNTLSIFILTMLLLHWTAYAILMPLGVFAGIFAYYLYAPDAFLFSIDTRPLTFADIANTFLVSIVMGFIFIKRKSVMDYAKLQAVQAVGSNIAHELRTPLTSIEAGITGIKNYFPILLDCYEASKKNNIEVPDIPLNHFNALLNVLESLEEETKYSNTIINMLLIRSKQKVSSTDLKVYSISNCIEQALKRYPFKEGEMELVEWHKDRDFAFKGEMLLIIHVFFNLLKNALYFIEQERKGTIKIWIEETLRYHTVHFLDTAQGVPDHIQPKLFQRFNSYLNRGTGLGLAFCKNVMIDLRGDIRCRSNYGEFTDFTLYFPKIAEVEYEKMILAQAT